MKLYISIISMFFVVPLVLFFSSHSTAETDAIADDKAEPWDQWAEAYPGWVEPYEPFNVIDNIYYVGSRGIPSYLITTPDGHIVLDGGMPHNAPQILANITKLGFKTTDVKILLNSHAHFDHSGGLAELKRETGAQLMAHKGDVESLESGLYAGSENPNYSAPPVSVDVIFDHEQKVVLGGVSLIANLTPGHSPGCTSWSMSARHDDRDYQVLFFCSATVAGNRLVGPPQYHGIVDDYRLTFERTKSWRPDVFLSNHSSFFDMEAKRQAKAEGNALAFVDRDSFPSLMKALRVQFEQSLLKQQAELDARKSNP